MMKLGGKRIRGFTLCIVCGFGANALLTVLLSVGTGWIPMHKSTSQLRPDDSDLKQVAILNEQSRFGTTRRGWQVRPIEIVSGREAVLGFVYLDNLEDLQTNQEWGDLHEAVNLPLSDARIVDAAIEEAHGWPFRSFWCEIGWDNTGNDWTLVSHGGFLLSDDEVHINPEYSGLRVIPYRPVWSGVVLNTAILGLFLSAVLLGPGLIRRVIRRRRGHCLQCGYDLLGEYGAGCPECGWGRSANDQTNQQSAPA